jgi:AraC family transcriptional regulator of adaptative response/methylated-DNA-[protein]-cysteine methyltransferase
MRLFQNQYSSPLGELIAVTSLSGLCLLTFQEEKHFILPFLAKISQYYQNSSLEQDSSQPIQQQTSTWLQSYFQNKEANKPEPALPPFDLIGTDFAKLVWNKLLTVPKTELRSYGWLAAELQNPKAVRAVGRTVGDNPIALMIPCHRIVGANGSLTGYRGGLWRKEWLLKHEGYQGFSV